jgi:hypothetical protein
MAKTKRKSKAATSSKVQPRTGAEQKSITSKPRGQSKQERVLDLLVKGRKLIINAAEAETVLRTRPADHGRSKTA